MKDKSVLVIDTPNNCSECPCCYVLENDWGDFISARCQMKYKGFVDKYSEYNKGRPSWCPLRPIDLDAIEDENPYKIVGRSETYSQYNEGWCDAIDRIRGELDL